MKKRLQLLLAIKQKGLTQREFSKCVSDSEVMVSRFINEWWNIDEERMKMYALILGKEPKEIFGEELS